MPELRAGQTVEFGGKKYLVVGKTFGSKLKFVRGDVFTLESEQWNVERDEDRKLSRVTAWAPEVIEKAKGKPDSLKTVVERARKHGVLREKVKKEGGEIEYLPNESGDPRTAYKGGPGSGHFGHAGRPGRVGGSSEGISGGKIVESNLSWRSEDTIVGSVVIEHDEDIEPNEEALQSFLSGHLSGEVRTITGPKDVESISIKNIERGSGYTRFQVDVTPTEEAGARWLDEVGGEEEWELYHGKELSFTPPQKVQQAAKLGLELRRQFGRGGTRIGVARARDLSNGRSVSLDTIERMRSYFARHAVDAEAEGWEDKENPSAGWVAWLLWGGDAGRDWAERVYEEATSDGKVKAQKDSAAVAASTKARQRDVAEYPEEDKKLRFVAQEHLRGKSAHLDLRFEYKRGKDHYLRGWTVSNQQPGAIKKPVTTVEELNKIVANPRNWKMNLDTGEIKPREVRGGTVRKRGNLRAFPKGVEIPADWLAVSGVTKEPDPGEPIPAGATRHYPGVFKILDKGTVEWGSVRPWAREFFIDGAKWKGRWLFRLVRREGEKWYTPESEEEYNAFFKQAEVLPPGEEEEQARRGDYWICFPSGIEIVANPSPMPIEDLEVGQRVMTREGRYSEITCIFQRPFSGDLVCIRPWKMREVRCTPNHPVFAIRARDCPLVATEKCHAGVHKPTCLGNSCPRYRDEYKGEWVRAENLRRGDFIYLPRPQIPIQIPSAIKLGKNSKSYSKNRRIVHWTSDFAWMVGLYLAEGSLRSYQSSMPEAVDGVAFALHEDEKDLIERLSKWTQENHRLIRVKTRKESRGIQAEIYDRYLAEWLSEHCGRGAHKKSLSAFLTLPDALLLEMLKGLFQGDAHRSRKGWRLATVSSALAETVRLAFLRLGIVPACWRAGMKARFLNGREIGPYTLHYVEVYGKDLAYFEGKEQEPSKVGPYGWRESEGFWVRIRNVGRSHYEGLVHNLEVEPDNSYLVPFAVHNCMQPLDQTPYVLSDEARKKQWLPPFGISALPSKMRKAVPENLRYWNMKDLRKALEARDKLSEMEELGGTELKSDEKLHLERFRSEGIDEDLKHPKKRKQELLADLRYLGNSGWPRLEKGEPWGEWTKKDVRAYFAAIVDALRGIGLAIAPPEPDDPKHDTSYWRLYRSARPLMESEPPKEDSKGGPGSGHHGHAGRPGKVGGSALGSPSGLGRSTSPEELSRKSDARGLSVLEKNIVSESERADSLRTRLFKDKPERAFSKMKDPEVRGQVKQEVIEKISSASGVDEDTVSGILKTWAETSKATPESIRLQEAAAEEFGLPRPDLKPLMDSSGKVPEFSKEQARSVLRAMYDTTQADLKKAGFSKTDSILVFRGVKRTEGKYRLGESIRYRGNPLQSWSVLWETARSFGSTKSSKEIGLILAAEVPISAILCSARTGLGCLGEYEIVCFCDRLGNSATIISLSEKNARTWSNADE